MPRVLVLVALAGCLSSTPERRRDDELSTTRPIERPLHETTCDATAGVLHPLLGAGNAWGEELEDLIQDRCLSDGWSAVARACGDVACVAAALTGWQRERLLGVVASGHRFDLARTPHSAELACTADCAPPPAATPCERAALRIAGDLARDHRQPSWFWAGLAGMLLDQCRILAWSPAAADCVGADGITEACMALLTPQQKHDPEIVIAMFLQAAP